MLDIIGWALAIALVLVFGVLFATGVGILFDELITKPIIALWKTITRSK